MDTFFTKLLTWLSNIGHIFLDFTSDLAKSIADNGGQVLIDAAEAEVNAAEQAGLAALTSGGSATTGEEKFASAQAGVIKTLESEGIPVIMNSVNGAIEAAVAKLKAAVSGTSTQPVAPVTAATVTAVANAPAGGTAG